jgi:hypothetical protein
MTIEIKRYYDGTVLYTATDARDVRHALEQGVVAGANLRGADLRGANLRGADLRGANLRGANLLGANLLGANLRDANLRGANLLDANLLDANLRGANLLDANLRGANLLGANLLDANLLGADLRGADLRGANLRGANLLGADLRGANLLGANLLGANLLGANLRDDASDHRHPLHTTRSDLWAILDEAPAEVAGLLDAITSGRIDGSTYEGACRCLVGTIAQVRGCAYTDLEHIDPDGGRLAELWFGPIHPGDEPVDEPEREGQFRAGLAARWIAEWRESRKRLTAAFAGGAS